ncbi:uncharacterized protein LOC114360744, partial [Ostrinia furnacalis]|uniref:uncharacterized protein LOC114360744 n=1 Tax=Ostrinia furnacalis TaxID=93504 RepID=UPI00103C3840
MECGRLDSGLRWSARTYSDNYLITYPSDEETSKVDEVPSSCYENPIFVPKVLESDLMKSETANFEDETVVYLSTSKAAKLERALRNAGYKK